MAIFIIRLRLCPKSLYARSLSGPQHLQAVAVSAARLARFNPTLVMGKPVKVSGTLSYDVRPN
ncbi:MAG TPA: hypothetical protein VIX17_25510 [Pyrinomonadaceae bacterium]|jgi:hypothetical protein